MFRKFLATTAVATLLASGAIAQDATKPADPAMQAQPATPAPAEPAPADAAAAPVAKADGQLASNIIGEAVYNGSGENAENIGDVNDLVIDANGAIKSLVVGVGGFLGVGEKNVEVEYKTAEWTEKDGDRWIVVTATKEQLEALPAFDPAPFEPVAPMPTAATPAAPATPTAPAETTTPPADAPAAAPATEEPKPAN